MSAISIPHRWTTLIATLALAMSVSTGARAATTTLKIGTLLPQESPWGKEFKKWAAQVETDTGGELHLDFQWNGQAGDEILMVQKIRTGQLDAATLSATGLAQTGVTDVLVFQLPGLFPTWNKLDAVRSAIKDDLESMFESKGFTILGWGDVGAVKTLSVGFEVHRPSDLRGKNVCVIAGDPIAPFFFSTIGGTVPKSVSIAEILPGLTNGSINVLAAPPIIAEQLQWASRITHMGSRTVAFAIGAFIASSARMKALPQKLKDAMAAHGGEMQARLDTSIRKLDAQSFARMRANKRTYELTEEELGEWKSVFERMAARLRGTVFTPALFDRVIQLARD